MGMTTKEYHEGYQQGFKDAKVDYETRLKADMVAMLTEIQFEIEEMPMHYDPRDVNDLIQQKIDKLKEVEQ